MGWNEVNVMDLRKEFVLQASAPGANMSQLCQHYQISRKTGYKWLNRYLDQGKAGLSDQSTRPRSHPKTLSTQQKERILVAAKHKPFWGAHKVYHWMKLKGEECLPSQSSFHRVMAKEGLIDNQATQNKFTRFEHERPNDLWQADFKGHFAMDSGRCHPFTVLDDHSRFSLGIKPCANERTQTVKTHLTHIFKTYGLPARMNFDNGPPWGRSEGCCSSLGAWLIRLGIFVSYSAPYHPQTNGKLERFHRSLKAELLRYRHYRNLDEIGIVFEQWRNEYNLERPHEALGMRPPIHRYTVSKRRFPDPLPEVVYDSPEDHTRKVCYRGFIKFQSHQIRVGQALQAQYVAVRPLDTDGHYGVYYCHQLLFAFDLTDYKKLRRWTPKSVTHVLEEVLPRY